MKDSYKRTREKYPENPELDLHYYGMKGYGIKDDKIEEGRPKFHLLNSEKLFSVVPLISSKHSPYEFSKGSLTYKGKDLPFKVKNIGRIETVKRNSKLNVYRH